YSARQRSIDREQCGSLFCPLCVVSVYPIHDEAELKARREWRRKLRLHHMHADLARFDAVQHLLQSRHVESILQHIAVSLYENWKARELLYCLEEIESFQ